MKSSRKYDREVIRAEWEAGVSITSLSKKYGCAKSWLSKIIKAEGWTRKKKVNKPVFQRVNENRTVHSFVHPSVDGDGEKLSAQQEMFVLEYLKDFNATQAAARAGMHPGSGRRLILMPKIKKAVAETGRGLAVDRLVLAERLVQEDINRAFFDISSILDFGPGYAVVKPLESLPREASACISKVREVRQKDGSTTVEVEVYNKDAAAERLYRTLGMFKDKIEHSADDPLAAVLRDIANRGRGLPKEQSC